jgi:hypothetical protein
MGNGPNDIIGFLTPDHLTSAAKLDKLKAVSLTKKHIPKRRFNLPHHLSGCQIVVHEQSLSLTDHRGWGNITGVTNRLETIRLARGWWRWGSLQRSRYG